MVPAAAEPVGFLGLGRMGMPMAANLAGAVPLLVWNRTASASAELAGRTPAVVVARTPAEVFERCQTVILMLADEQAIDDVLGWDGQTQGWASAAVPLAGRTVVQMGTLVPEHSRELGERIRGRGGRYVEAPVSGSRQPAVDGTLVAMLAGEDADVDRVARLVEPMCATVFRCGVPPQALAMKLAVNTFLITLVTGLAESFHFAEEQGLDPELLNRILAAGPMASPVSTNKGAKLVAADWTPHAAIHDVLKNCRLVVGEARRGGHASPLMDVCAELYTESLAEHAGDDMAAVISAIRARDGR